MPPMPPASPASTLLLRAVDAEARHSPELSYLASWVELQARRAFGELEVMDLADPLEEAGERLRERLGRAPSPRGVLVLADVRTLVTATTLERMAEVLEQPSPGAGNGVPGDVTAVAPRPLEQAWAVLPRTVREEIHTLRGFERAEAGILEAEDAGELKVAPPGSPIPSPPPPVLLVAPALVRQALDVASPHGETAARETSEEASGWGRLLTALEAVLAGRAVGDGSPLPRTGVYHRFVDYYGEVRSDVLPHLPAGVHRVLEVGCGRGVTGELLRRELGAEVTGVELHPGVAEDARGRLARVVIGDVEDPATAEELARLGPFDLVLALELFEHLAYPERFLERAAGLLRPGGTILLSTPNVGHWSVVEDLLAGRWDYLPIGLLCYTHLRFFTRRTLEDWLERLGLGEYELIPQATGPSPRLEELTESTPLPAGLELDRESLRTKGFYVRIKVGTPKGQAGTEIEVEGK